MRRRTFVAAGLAVALFPGRSMAAGSIIDTASAEAVGNAQTAVDKVRAVIAWTHEKLDWTATDYQKRTPAEILERGGGNCYEQAVVVRALLEPAGVKTRIVREVNIQPASVRRQYGAEKKIGEVGLQASVFGERHNDHAWTEFWDEQGREWTPSDPTLNILGYEKWVNARLGFGARPVHEIIPYADMLFPIAILAPVEVGVWESRSARYLVQGFAQYVPDVSKSPFWPKWVELVQVADAHLLKTFQGQYNFHQDKALIDALIATYQALKATRLPGPIPVV